MENIENFKFIAFIDILGFKELIEKKSHAELIEIYNRGFALSNQISSSKNNYVEYEINGEFKSVPDISKSEINSFLFSDSIVYWTNNTTKHCFEQLLIVLKNTFQISLLNGLPLRAAISVGELSFTNYAPSNENNVFIQNCIVGKGLSETYVLESKQNWSGCLISDKCINFIEENQMEDILEKYKSTNDLIEYDVPMKDKNQKFLVLNWIYGFSNMTEDKIKDLFAKHDKDITNSEVEMKINNTIKFYQHIKNL